MREIKFRAFAPFDKTWHYWDVYGDYPQGIYGGLSNPQQYIGIKDINGVEIYEGDILNDKYTVEYYIRSFAFTYRGVPCLMFIDKMLVTGNIHEKTDKSTTNN